MTNDKGPQGLNLESQEAMAQAGTTAAAGLPETSDDAGRLHPRLRLHRGFQSRYLPDDRDVIIYLPPEYDRHPERTYPVLYLQDGQNLFDGRTSFVPGRTWQVREHADEAIKAAEVEPLVIVGGLQHR
jgi:enterochelin esterase-like enzyme